MSSTQPADGQTAAGAQKMSTSRATDVLIFACFAGLLGLLYTAGDQHQREFHPPGGPAPPPADLGAGGAGGVYRGGAPDSGHLRPAAPTRSGDHRGPGPGPSPGAAAAGAAVAAPGGRQPETFTLVNSFWEDTNPSERYREMLGAMRANIVNKGLAQLVVLYETTSEDRAAACAKFVEALYSPLEELKLWHAEVTCVGRPKGQPTYEAILTYASSQPDGPFRGSVVLVANGDVVLDESLRQMPAFVGHVAYALTVNTDINARVYEVACGFKVRKGKKHGSKVTSKRCPFYGADKNGPHALSYDGFAFKPPLPDGFAEKARSHSISLDEVMNKMGMENRAKCGLEAGGVMVLNSCIWVRLQHYHKTGGYSHNMKMVKFAPDFYCSRSTYPCMVRYNGTAPPGAAEATPVVSTAFCDNVDPSNLVPHAVTA